MKRARPDITIIATGIMVKRSLAAAEKLANLGIEAEVTDPRTLVTLDKELLINSVCRTGRLLVVYEACERGGCGAGVVATLASSEGFDYLEAPIERLGEKNVPIPYCRELEKLAVPQ